MRQVQDLKNEIPKEIMSAVMSYYPRTSLHGQLQRRSREDADNFIQKYKCDILVGDIFRRTNGDGVKEYHKVISNDGHVIVTRQLNKHLLYREIYNDPQYPSLYTNYNNYYFYNINERSYDICKFYLEKRFDCYTSTDCYFVSTHLFKIPKYRGLNPKAIVEELDDLLYKAKRQHKEDPMSWRLPKVTM
jgi:hypothetical protein